LDLAEAWLMSSDMESIITSSRSLLKHEHLYLVY
jgi:hypothetical protein